MLLAGLSTGHLIGLLVVAAAFIAFALVSSFVVPRYRPDFPGRAGVGVFSIASIALFAAMIAAVAVFGREEAEAAEGAGATGRVVHVQEREYRIQLATKTLAAGETTFVVEDTGKLQHDLAIRGPNVDAKTALIDPGGDASLTVTLAKGTYTLWCTVPGHRALGMVAVVRVP